MLSPSLFFIIFNFYQIIPPFPEDTSPPTIVLSCSVNDGEGNCSRLEIIELYRQIR